jgi:GDPmannose 4,6-dehydratase
MTRSLILGVNGQDGSYLAEALLRRGHEVIGLGRDEVSRYVPVSEKFRYLQIDLRNADTLARIVSETAPNHAFHFAAVHGAASFEYESVWRDTVAVGLSALHVLLEHARTHAPHMRVFYASSAKIFPLPLSGIIDEMTSVRATCLYSISKIASREIIFHYRRQHGVSGTNLILFNHESVRRPSEYLLPTVARAIAASLLDPSHRVALKTLDFWIDWSAADELMDIVADIAEAADEDELILASGKTWLGRDIVRELFARYDLDFQRHVTELLPPSDPGAGFSVSLERLEKTINRRPVKTIASVVDEMISADA